jgi:hypothetical protein
MIVLSFGDGWEPTVEGSPRATSASLAAYMTLYERGDKLKVSDKVPIKLGAEEINLRGGYCKGLKPWWVFLGLWPSVPVVEGWLSCD